MLLRDYLNERQQELQRRLAFPMGIFPAIGWNGSDFINNYYSVDTQIRTIKTALERIPMDFVRTVTDMVLEAEVLGAQAKYTRSEPPSIIGTLNIDECNILISPSPLSDGRMPIQLAVISETKKMIQSSYPDKLLLGSCNGPFTIIGQLFGSSQAVIKTVIDGAKLHGLLEQVTCFLINYASAIADAGADILWVSDPLASVLSPQQYWEFSGQYTRRLFAAIDRMTILHICGDTLPIVEQMVRTGAHGISLDERVSLMAAQTRVGRDVVLIGNISPIKTMKNGTLTEVRKDTQELLYKMMPYNNFILSTGCSLPINVSQENIKIFYQCAKDMPIYLPEVADILLSIGEAVLSGSKQQAVIGIHRALKANVEPVSILNGCLVPAINYLGWRYQRNEVFIPELLMAAEAMYAGLDILRPLIISGNEKPKGTVVIGTVENDLHDIGKNLVALMLESNFYNIVDLGKNVAAQSFIDAAKTQNADIIALSALTTMTMESMKEIISAIRQDPDLQRIPIIVGGAPLTQSYADKIGANGYAPDAAEAVLLVEKIVSGLTPCQSMCR